MFVDIAKIKIKAGDGGAGAVAFHREKYVGGAVMGNEGYILTAVTEEKAEMLYL